MREILFRGKRYMDGEWVDGSLFIDEKKEKHEILVGYVNYRVGWEVIPETVGQFTGMTDKNGKKIFEGDIVKFEYFYSKYIGKINFNDKTIGFEMWYNTTVGAYGEQATHKILLCHAQSMEVIGNIHDNPELLKGEK